MSVTSDQPVSAGNASAIISALKGSQQEVLAAYLGQDSQYNVFVTGTPDDWESVTAFAANKNHLNDLVTLDVPLQVGYSYPTMSNGEDCTVNIEQATGQFNVRVFNATDMLFYKMTGVRAGGGGGS